MIKAEIAFLSSHKRPIGVVHLYKGRRASIQADFYRASSLSFLCAVCSICAEHETGEVLLALMAALFFFLLWSCCRRVQISLCGRNVLSSHLRKRGCSCLIRRSLHIHIIISSSMQTTREGDYGGKNIPLR